MTDEPEVITDGSIEMAALRRILYELGDKQGDEHTALEAAIATVERINSLENDVAELQAQNQELRETIDNIIEIGNEKSTKEEKIASIVTWAERQTKNPTRARVTVTAREIVGCTGVTRRYAYDLIDKLPEEYEWILDRHEVSQYGDLELDKDGMTRALIVDFEQLHTDEGVVNKFTTGSRETGVAD